MMKKVNIKLLLEYELLCVFERNGKNWRLNFWTKTQSKWRCHQFCKKRPLKCKTCPRSWDVRLKFEKQKEFEEIVKMLVLGLKSEKKAHISIKKVSKVKKTHLLLKSASKVQKQLSFLKKAVKVEINHQKMELKPENKYRKSWKKLQWTKNCKVEKIGKILEKKEKLKNQFQKNRKS